MTRLRRILQPVNWTYALGELTLIVAGVLIALAANAWWVGREERTRERQYIQQLNADFALTERILTQARDDEARITDASWQLLIAIHSDGSLPQDSVATWFSRSATASSVRIVSGTLEALVATGEINGITNDSIRSNLISFAGRVEQDLAALRELRAELLRIRAERNRLVDPFDYWIASDSTALPGVVRRFPVDWHQMLRDPAFNALVSSTWTTSVNRWGILEGLIPEIRTLRAFILEEMGEPGLDPFCPVSEATGAELTSYLGLYWTPLGPVQIEVDRDALRLSSASATGRMTPVGFDTFCSQASEAMVRFKRDTADNIVEITVEQWGRTFSGPRVE